ncbi:uncharacterized protein SPPG_05489 [Spizellomyces punctatus DAOM BR117]|uniref:DNA-directed DNA polymerase n=1 Tax=Spizellomyces punctatus (strain DAOM BR117) TaxID=645134 RepID=A0A0L0HEP5_SPIPD|nr:uncharacterized protein SPPG_05489 [Spizellomyces punctatus DAOM BR117]KNC99233.1 hypothetical protein SPPG_05489 [Spizellomyces punctatus DAOM BR117]|eukprot:XP_016607273.1 hypothetical protein SPPG_05489 [Spizellomyces punctatus DAOM BR117]
MSKDLDIEYIRPLDPRNAFFGGRTNASKLYYKCSEKERVKYCDFTSQYPWVNAFGEYPCYSFPTRILNNFDGQLNYNGFIKCRIVPPRGLYHPVLPDKINNKTMFVLCKNCAEKGISVCRHSVEQRAFVGTWCIPEVKLVLSKGYVISQVYEVLHFENTGSDLFKDYIFTFLKIKQEASGYPKWCKNDDDRKKYIDDYKSKQGIRLDPAKIVYNEGLRLVAKLMLNSLWGKFGQKNNMRKHITINAEENPDEYYSIMFNAKYIVHDIVDYDNGRTLDLSYSLHKAAVRDDKNTSIFIAAYTTALAHCKLYSVLDTVGEKVLYYDTDSIIYVDDDIGSTEKTLPYGNYLGDLTDELKGDHIVEFVSGGAKNYSYILNKTGRAKTVCKGFTLSYENGLNLGHESMKDIVFNPRYIDDEGIEKESCVNFNFSEINISKTHSVRNKTKIIIPEKNNLPSKKYKFVYNKRVVQEFNSESKVIETLPFGF